MSGGSYDYVCYKIEEAANSLRNLQSDPRRASFKKLLLLVANAMHDIEWVDSCDSGPGDEHASIDAVFAFFDTQDVEILKKAHAFDGIRDRLKEFLE